MANYLLVENRETVLLGPMNWRQRFFQEELKDLEVEFQVPPVEQGYLRVNDSLEFFPIVSIESPEIDLLFEQPVGPFWTYDNNEARGVYQKIPGSIDAAKGNMKTMAANRRYVKENTPFKMTVQGQEVTIDVSRDNRNIFVQKYQMMADGETVQWKFPEGWVELTKIELGGIVAAGAAHIQTQFDWEKNIGDQIDAAPDVDTLKTILNEINGVTV